MVNSAQSTNSAARQNQELIAPGRPGWRECLKRARRGFTLIELMVVMAIISVLLAIALPIYQKSVIRAKESVLRNNLFTIRTMIDEYTIDKQKAPESLQDLVSEGYLRQVPQDPMTGSDQTWHVIMEDTPVGGSNNPTGIFDVKSGSDKTGLDGTPYSNW
ncbi:MAG: type II secretion system protein [Acidobacteriaceae bacterium]|nr:type II secretion system protein [Acidobacteriaceae bacterium]